MARLGPQESVPKLPQRFHRIASHIGIIFYNEDNFTRHGLGRLLFYRHLRLLNLPDQSWKIDPDRSP
jgi:hypothetical protein